MATQPMNAEEYDAYMRQTLSPEDYAFWKESQADYYPQNDPYYERQPMFRGRRRNMPAIAQRNRPPASAPSPHESSKRRASARSSKDVRQGREQAQRYVESQWDAMYELVAIEARAELMRQSNEAGAEAARLLAERGTSQNDYNSRIAQLYMTKSVTDPNSPEYANVLSAIEQCEQEFEQKNRDYYERIREAQYRQTSLARQANRIKSTDPDFRHEYRGMFEEGKDYVSELAAKSGSSGGAGGTGTDFSGADRFINGVNKFVGAITGDKNVGKKPASSQPSNANAAGGSQEAAAPASEGQETAASASGAQNTATPASGTQNTATSTSGAQGTAAPASGTQNTATSAEAATGTTAATGTVAPAANGTAAAPAEATEAVAATDEAAGGESMADSSGEEPSIENMKIALEVLNRQWGNGNERVQRLRQAGHDQPAIQAIVNDYMGQYGTEQAAATALQQDIQKREEAQAAAATTIEEAAGEATAEEATSGQDDQLTQQVEQQLKQPFPQQGERKRAKGGWVQINGEWMYLRGEPYEAWLKKQKQSRPSFAQSLGNAFGSYFARSRGGLDASGVSTSQRAQAEISERAAADYQRAAQRNMQIANQNYRDEADKLAVAQAAQQNQQKVQNLGNASAGAAALARGTAEADYAATRARSDEQFAQGVQNQAAVREAQSTAEQARLEAKARDYQYRDMANDNAMREYLSRGGMDEYEDEDEEEGGEENNEEKGEGQVNENTEPDEGGEENNTQPDEGQVTEEEEETQPPVTEEEETQPPVTEEEETQPPVTEEEETQPPVTEEEETQPPVTEDEQAVKEERSSGGKSGDGFIKGGIKSSANGGGAFVTEGYLPGNGEYYVKRDAFGNKKDQYIELYKLNENGEYVPTGLRVKRGAYGQYFWDAKHNNQKETQDNITSGVVGGPGDTKRDENGHDKETVQAQAQAQAQPKPREPIKARMSEMTHYRVPSTRDPETTVTVYCRIKDTRPDTYVPPREREWFTMKDVQGTLAAALPTRTYNPVNLWPSALKEIIATDNK